MTERLYGFEREDLESIAEGLDGYEKSINVGNTTGEGDEHIESTTAAAARFIRAALANGVDSSDSWKCDQQCQARDCAEAKRCQRLDDPPCGHMLRGVRKSYCERCQRAAQGIGGVGPSPAAEPLVWQFGIGDPAQYGWAECSEEHARNALKHGEPWRVRTLRVVPLPGGVLPSGEVKR